MTNEEILKFQQRAKYVAAKRGYPELADDFAQELLLTFIQNPDRHSTVDQFFIDYLRGTYGDARSTCGSAKSFAMRFAVSLDVTGDEDEGQVALHDRLTDPEPESESERTQRECSLLFGGRQAQIYEAYFVNEQTQKTIGQSLEITESRVCQLLKPMKKEISDYYVLREGLERMEWDPDYSKLSVDWIRI